MSYYWRIKWKDYNEQDLLINENQASIITNGLVMENGPERFIINGVAYRYDAVDVVEPTAKKIPSDMKMLRDEHKDLKKGPLLDDDGFVVANWYKKTVSSKEFEKYYAGHPSYFTLERQDSGNIVVAFRRVEELNADRPSDIELCTKQEAERLWKSYE